MAGSLLDVHHAWFTLFGHPMSALEFFGTLFNLWAVWLMAGKRVWTWPVGLVATALFAVLFFEIQMYSDVLEQAYYFGTNCWGWWLWTRGDGEASPLRVSLNSARDDAALAAAIGAASLALGWAMSRVHLWLPAFFPQPASFPYLDAFTVAMSLVAQMLAAYQKLENWLLWMLVNAISAWMYYERGVWFVAALFAVFFALSMQGWRHWRAELAGPRLSPAPA